MARKDSALTVRLTNQMAEKFKTYAQNKKLSQSDFLVELLKHYDKNKIGYDNGISDELVEIPIILSYENYFLKQAKDQVREPKKYLFKGKYVYWPPHQKLKITAKKYEEKLSKEFRINQDLQEYDFYYWFGVAKDSNKSRFVIVETFYLAKKDDSTIMLNVNRGKFASDLLEITQHIKDYALYQDVKNLEYILAKVITEDKEFESFLV